MNNYYCSFTELSNYYFKFLEFKRIILQLHLSKLCLLTTMKHLMLNYDNVISTVFIAMHKFKLTIYYDK